MSTEKLTGKQLRYLRRLAHNMKPVVLVGTKGVVEIMIKHVETALEQHELIKIRMNDTPMDEVRQGASDLLEGTGAALVQRIGHTVVLYRKRRKGKPDIKVPSFA